MKFFAFASISLSSTAVLRAGTQCLPVGHCMHYRIGIFIFISPLKHIVRVIKSGHVARMGERRGVYRFLVEKPEGKNHWGDQGVDGRTILRWIFRKMDMGYGLDRAGSV